MEKSISNDCRFDVTIKKFGELHAVGVIAKFIKSDKALTHESLESNEVTSYNLDSVMPTMEKYY